jgi:hypothetical protein
MTITQNAHAPLPPRPAQISAPASPWGHLVSRRLVCGNPSLHETRTPPGAKAPTGVPVRVGGPSDCFS